MEIKRFGGQRPGHDLIVRVLRFNPHNNFAIITITRSQLHEAGWPRLARISHVCETYILKINFAITLKISTRLAGIPASIPASRAEKLTCNRDCRANTFSSLNFASEQNGTPEDRYFSFYITHIYEAPFFKKGLILLDPFCVVRFRRCHSSRPISYLKTCLF